VDRHVPDDQSMHRQNAFSRRLGLPIGSGCAARIEC